MLVKLIFVHGIAQDPGGKDQLHAKWRKLLRDHATQPELFDAAPSAMAFYADILDAATNGAEIVHMGPGGAPSDEAELAFISAGLRQMAREMGVSDAEIRAVSTQNAMLVTIEQSGMIGRALVGALSAIETRLPGAGTIGVRVLKQAHVYLSRPKTREAIDQRLKNELSLAVAAGQRTIVVAHSLGTVVAFKVLRELIADGIEVPLLVTMGSPLSISAIKNGIGLPWARPSLLASWNNFYDRGDAVALGRGLTEATFAAGIFNDGTVDNDTSNAHSIEGYLSHPEVIRLLESSLRNNAP